MKTRVEKLCQAFENGKELVELSQCSPHDISNVLKLYLRQVRDAGSCRFKDSKEESVILVLLDLAQIKRHCNTLMKLFDYYNLCL